jgi:two-component system, chemotaxis family, sensor kinase CheA
MSDFSAQEIAEFLVEGADLLGQAEQALLDLEDGKDFAGNFNTVFRAFHSVKGAAGMFQWAMLQEHMHHLEQEFNKLRDAKAIDSEQADLFLRGVDGAKKLLLWNYPRLNGPVSCL